MMPVFVPADYFRELRKGDLFPDASRPLEVDLGCGDGTFLVELARHHPDRDFLGVERLAGRVSKTARKIRRAGLANAKVMRLESSYTTGWLLPTAGVSRLHLLCPDPWPKARHHKNRLINDAEFLAGLTRVIEPGGEFLLKTDHQEYFDNALESIASVERLQRLDWPEDAFFYPRTDFENHWQEFGRSIHRARWRRAA